MSRGRRAAPKVTRWGGLGQLTLVEHALCPLDTGQSLRKNLVFETGYYYADRSRHRRKAAVTVTCPQGLSPSDEFYLWGLLALTFAEAGAGGPADGEFHATPHYCLRRLGLVDQLGNRGGRQYQQFADALDRLAAVSYASDAFYDPVRAEHRRVRFHFLSYSLPLDPHSPRAWRVAWDPVFFDLVRPLGGHFRFDLETYRRLDPAARRLFLLLSKIFDRRATTPCFAVEHLAVDVLGFAPTLAPRHQRQKLGRVVDALAAAGVVSGPAVFERRGAGKAAHSHTIAFTRGPRWDRATPAAAARHASDSPLWDGLLALGFDAAGADRLIRRHPGPAVREWLDITLAARERFGHSFFRRSPQAFLVDNLKQAATSGRTPPDWWQELRSRERQRARPPAAPGGPTPDPCRAVLRRVTAAVFSPEGETPTGTPGAVLSVADILRRRR
ncbi:MAG: hypothetical protein K2X82_05820 [Gemmataceae bacterium]|nr:hypothetical protein [Gemmataceae bacterium]